MHKSLKILILILSGTQDKNNEFSDILYLLDYLGFKSRIKGSHFIFYKSGIEEIINIQSTENNKSKPYQVKQIRNIIIKYKLGGAINEQI